MNKLLILDGNSVLHRAYYALPDWRNRSGEATAGVYGFLSMLLKAIEELKPTHLAVVFDNPAPTFRHNMYVGYQTNREKDRQISEDIWGQVEKLKIVFEKMGVPVFCVAGFEADDLAGTLTKQAEKKMEVIIITGDKDYMQLVNKKVTLYMPQKGLSDGKIIDIEGVKEKLGVTPDQVIEYKALVGDSSDNYPGVPGIGPKTAITLLEKYETFENIYKKLDPSVAPQDDISVGIKQKLINGYESGELSRRLATMNCESPVILDIDAARLPDGEKMQEVFAELGHKSLLKRAGGTPDANSTSARLFE
ncbi:MAG: 5'-3' exonuclease H3TH domain-containing protein [Patescibacteria group bacterium]